MRPALQLETMPTADSMQRSWLDGFSSLFYACCRIMCCLGGVERCVQQQQQQQHHLHHPATGLSTRSIPAPPPPTASCITKPHLLPSTMPTQTHPALRGASGCASFPRATRPLPTTPLHPPPRTRKTPNHPRFVLCHLAHLEATSRRRRPTPRSWLVSSRRNGRVCVKSWALASRWQTLMRTCAPPASTPTRKVSDERRVFSTLAPPPQRILASPRHANITSTWRVSMNGSSARKRVPCAARRCSFRSCSELYYSVPL